jgi:hypothetical protein
VENALSTGTSNEYTAEGKTTSIRARDKNTPMGPAPNTYAAMTNTITTAEAK